MAAGPFYPSSIYYGDTSGNTFPSFYVGTNQGGTANAAPADEGIGVVASLSADSVVQLRFILPPGSSAPSGTMKLILAGLANADPGTAANAKITVSDGVVSSSGGIPSGVSLSGETLVTLSWSTGSNDAYQQAKVALSSSWQADGVLVVALTFNHTSWTLAANLTLLCWLVWE